MPCCFSSQYTIKYSKEVIFLPFFFFNVFSYLLISSFCFHISVSPSGVSYNADGVPFNRGKQWCVEGRGQFVLNVFHMAARNERSGCPSICQSRNSIFVVSSGRLAASPPLLVTYRSGTWWHHLLNIRLYLLYPQSSALIL